MEEQTFCGFCGDLCAAVEETFDYAGAHCNHGIAGTHRTGHYVSDCCGDDLLTWDEWYEKFGPQE